MDNAVREIGALNSGDDRQFEVAVAGPSALLVAKLHKIADRRGQPARQDDKDALDVYRLLRGLPVEAFEIGIARLLEHELAREVTDAALDHLEVLFWQPGAEGLEMAARAVEGLEDPASITAALSALADELLVAIRR